MSIVPQDAPRNHVVIRGSQVRFDLDQANEFLQAVHGSGVGKGDIALILKLRDRAVLGDAKQLTDDLLKEKLNVLWSDCKSIEGMDEQLVRAIEIYWNVYVTVGRYGSGTLGRRSDNVCVIPGTWADLDIKPSAEGGFATPDELDQFALSLAEPTVVVDTGSGGRHPYWLLDEPLTDMTAARKLLDAWRAYVLITARNARRKVDLGVFDFARMLRLPGTVRHPKVAKYETITQPMPVRLLKSDGPRYTLKQLQALTNTARLEVEKIQRDHKQANVEDVKIREREVTLRGLSAWVYHDVMRVFDAKQDWAPLLESTGWKLDSDNRHRTGTTSARYWTRPGKTEGCSADTDYGSSTVMHVFSDDPSLDDLFIRPRDGVHHVVSKYRYALVRLFDGDEVRLLKAIMAGKGRIL